ncbi:MAG: monovalent cation/H(+) antiporter subunit G [Halanaerobiales bacterium]
MFALLRELIISFLLLGGMFFFFVATVGLMRLPDVFSRMHATTKCDTLGVSMILLGVAIKEGISPVSLKLFLVIIFLWITTPTAAHTIARASYDTHKYIVKKIDFLDKIEED